MMLRAARSLVFRTRLTPGLRRIALRCASTNADKYDVVISGGGIVGCVLGCHLGLQQDADIGRIALIDTVAPQSLESLRDKVQPDIRVYALSPASVKTLSVLGVWDRILDVRPDIGLSADMQVWDCASRSHIYFEGSEDEPLNYVVEHDVLHAALSDRVSELASTATSKNAIDILRPASIVKQSFHLPDPAQPDWIQCKVMQSGTQRHDRDEGVEMRCRLLVGADGSNSQVRSMCGLGSWGWEYQNAAVVATVRTDALDGSAICHRTAWQRFLSTGPVALLPLHAGFSSIVWSTSVAEAERLKTLSDAQFCDELNLALQDPTYLESQRPAETNNANGNGNVGGTVPSTSLTALVDSVLRGANTALTSILPANTVAAEIRSAPRVSAVCSPRFSFPLRFNQASTYYRERVALLGDAAHTVHPLAGQGLNLGITDAQVLGDVLREAAYSGQDLGSSVVLSRYERKRQLPNLLMGLGVDAIKRAYELPPQLAALRGLGVNFINAVPPLKALFASAARGSGVNDIAWATPNSNERVNKRGQVGSTGGHNNGDNNGVGDWLEAHDAESGEKYYYHRHTREVVWTRPA